MSKIIVIGASAGGVLALQRLAAELPAGLGVPVLVVLHVGAHPSVLPELMSASGPLPAAHAQTGQELEAGRIYIAPPDHHMLVAGTAIRLNRGPKEHHSRPAIDPLFLSAALSRGADVIGVILTGMLDDGTFGLQAIKECGGTAVVQDPTEAAEPSMPLSALENVEVDHCIGLADMAALLTSLASVPPAASSPRRREERLNHERALMLFEGDAMEHLTAIAKPSPFVCPDCRGGLWEVDQSKPVRYRCHTGHAFTIRTLQHALWSASDEAVWAALRALQEKGELIKHMAMSAKAAGDEQRARRLKAVADQIDGQAKQVHRVIEQAPLPVE
jgi:two-component system, chemotaxis family, protein-glutamate methylesterase/glutaminase